MTASTFTALLLSSMDRAAATSIESMLTLPQDIVAARGPVVSRRVCAMALNAVLLHDLLGRVPSGAAYVAERVRSGGRIIFDHGAVRTISLAGRHLGLMPQGALAMSRILVPLGYSVRGTYPLQRLRMTGQSYAHDDGAADIPQFFVSELHSEVFPQDFQTTAIKVFESSREPLDPNGRALLRLLAEHAAVDLEVACAGLPNLVACFGRQHATPALADYAALLSHSKEAAWIATEGNAFNHATDRVADVEVTAQEQRRRGRNVKDRVEISRSGRVRQTAFQADFVRRPFMAPDGGILHRDVPGSFFEFISRAPLRAGGSELDLGFDSSNAQGIFGMTAAGIAR